MGQGGSGYKYYENGGPNSFDAKKYLADVNQNVAQMSSPIDLMQRGRQDSPDSYALKQEFQQSAKFGQEAFQLIQSQSDAMSRSRDPKLQPSRSAQSSVDQNNTVINVDNGLHRRIDSQMTSAERGSLGGQIPLAGSSMPFSQVKEEMSNSMISYKSNSVNNET